MADSGQEISDGDDKLIADVEVEIGADKALSFFDRNKLVNEREPLLFLEEDKPRLQRSRYNNYVSYW